jgi:SHS2 domain-containing protein
MQDYETFSTTADVGIRIRGSGYENLLQNAVKGLNVLLFGEQIPTAASPSRYSFEYSGDSPENILVNLLAEIVFLVQNKNKITTALEIKEVDETYLKTDLLTIPADNVPELEIKSVTYHNLKIIRINGFLTAEVIFDI